MARRTLDYMPIAVYEIDTDRYCRKMTDAEFGRYMRLLIRQWIEGDVPMDPETAIEDALLDTDCAHSVAQILTDKFSPTSDGRGVNHRCLDIYNETVKRVKASRCNGRKGGRPAKPRDNLQVSSRFDLGSANRSTSTSISSSSSSGIGVQRKGANLDPVIDALEARLGRPCTTGDIGQVGRLAQLLVDDPLEADGQTWPADAVLLKAIEVLPPDVGVWHRYVAATIENCRADRRLPQPQANGGKHGQPKSQRRADGTREGEFPEPDMQAKLI